MRNSMEELYILELEFNKFYVGKSVDPNNRIRTHFEGRGSAWTKMFKPLRVQIHRPLAGAHDEDNTTLEYMAKYGIDNVRGGTYCQLVLTSALKDILQQQIRHYLNLCILCGLKRHSRCCPLQGGEAGNNWHPRHLPSRLGDTCFRCGRKGHWSSDCYA